MTMLRTSSDAQRQRVLGDNRRMAATISTLQRHERLLANTNKMQLNDIESLKNRLEKFGADNADLLEKLAEMKRERTLRERQFNEQMEQLADKLKDKQPDNDQLRETREQLETARQNADRLQQELDAERDRYADLVLKHAELRSRLEGMQLSTTQSLPAPKNDKSSVVQVRTQELKDQVRALTTELIEVRQKLGDQVARNGKVKQNIKRLVHEKMELGEKNHELSSALDNLKQNSAALEQQKEMLLEQIDKLKRALKACSVTEEKQKKQMQSGNDRNQELEQLLEQMRAKQSNAKRTEEMLRDELEKMKKTENDGTARETEQKHQLAKAHENYETLRRKMQTEIDQVKDESKRMNEEFDRLKKVNLHVADNERRLKVKLEEVKMEAESRKENLQQKVDQLRIDLQASEEVCLKLRKERDEMLQKWIPEERLANVETEMKQLREFTEQTEMEIQKLQEEQYVLQQKSQDRERELNAEIEKLHLRLKTEEEQIVEAADKSLELENMNEKLKRSYDEKEKLFKREHEKLEQTMKEQQDAFQEKNRTREEQHLAEKEHMLKMYKEKEKELKNKIKLKEFEIMAENDKLKAKCEQLKTAHTEKLREKDAVMKGRIKQLKVEIDEGNKLLEGANEKNKELQKIVDVHVSETDELKTLRSANDELKEKVGKLERAVLRLRLDNDDLREYKDYSRKNDNLKELSEPTNRTSELQLKVDMLRQALQDRSKTTPRRRVPPIAIAQSSDVDHRSRLLNEMAHLLDTAAKDGKRQVAESSTLTIQLEAERSKVRAGSERIAQLEHWLDTIFNDQQFGIGLSAAEQTSQITLPRVDTTAGKLKTQMTRRTSDRPPNKQKQTQQMLSRPKRQ